MKTSDAIPFINVVSDLFQRRGLAGLVRLGRIVVFRSDISCRDMRKSE
jgi:hypothetical protein